MSDFTFYCVDLTAKDLDRMGELGRILPAWTDAIINYMKGLGEYGKSFVLFQNSIFSNEGVSSTEFSVRNNYLTQFAKYIKTAITSFYDYPKYAKDFYIMAYPKY